MIRVAYLLDEHVPPAVTDALAAMHPEIAVVQIAVGPATPNAGISDREVLNFAEENELALVTFDKRTMPLHAAEHLASGRHTWGVFIFPKGNLLSPGLIAAELSLIWEASNADEWIDRLEFLPL